MNGHDIACLADDRIEAIPQAAIMLEWLCRMRDGGSASLEAAPSIRQAVDRAFAAGPCAPGIGGGAGRADVAGAVLGALA